MSWPCGSRGSRSEAPSSDMNYVYLLCCADDTLYCGWTTDLENRLAAHNEGRGAKYTRSRRPVRLVYYEEYEDRKEALSREWHLKRLSRAEKLELVEGFKAPAEKGKDRNTAMEGL